MTARTPHPPGRGGEGRQEARTSQEQGATRLEEADVSVEAQGAQKPAQGLTLVLPLPERLLNANSTVSMHWADKGRHVKAQRQTAALMARANLWLREGESLRGRVRIDIEIRPRPRMHRLDDDNFWASMKHYRDGLADAGVVQDDKQFVSGKLTWSKQRTAELVFTLTQEGD